MTSPQHVPGHVTLARRVSAAQAVLGILAVACVAFVFVRLVERWRVTPSTTSHRIVILGQRLSYPAANVAAIVVLGLALVGAVVVSLALIGAARELTASRRLSRRLSVARPLPGTDALVVDGERPHAFCAGLLRPRVYVTSGAVDILDHQALEAVLGHERHHARRRDPLRLAIGRVMARALFFLPAMTHLTRRGEALAEIGADESAVAPGPELRSALARAMLSFTEFPAAGPGVGIDPERVDHLLGEPPRWRFPTLLVLTAVALVALLAAVAVLAGREAAGSASLAPPFLSAQPCVVVLALIPAALVLAGIAAVRWRRPSNYTAS
jgi:beta-lactamase regulating signal transducer with metallopeptidase domain